MKNEVELIRLARRQKDLPRNLHEIPLFCFLKSITVPIINIITTAMNMFNTIIIIIQLTMLHVCMCVRVCRYV